MNVGELINAADKTVAVLRVLAPIAEQVADWLDGGPEPEVFATYPSELKSIAALERMKYRARVAKV